MGANTRDKKPVRTYGIEWNIIPWAFSPNTSDTTLDPAASQVIGQVTVTRAGTGLYHVTAAGGAPRSLFFLGGLQTDLKGLFNIEVGTVSTTVGKMQVRVFTYGTTTLVNLTATTSGQVVTGQIWQQASSYTR